MSPLIARELDTRRGDAHGIGNRDRPVHQRQDDHESNCLESKIESKRRTIPLTKLSNSTSEEELPHGQRSGALKLHELIDYGGD
jgi:hypothetical protein